MYNTWGLSLKTQKPHGVFGFQCFTTQISQNMGLWGENLSCWELHPLCETFTIQTHKYLPKSSNQQELFWGIIATIGIICGLQQKLIVREERKKHYANFIYQINSAYIWDPEIWDPRYYLRKVLVLAQFNLFLY